MYLTRKPLRYYMDTHVKNRLKICEKNAHFWAHSLIQPFYAGSVSYPPHFGHFISIVLFVMVFANFAPHSIQAMRIFWVVFCPCILVPSIYHVSASYLKVCLHEFFKADSIRAFLTARYFSRIRDTVIFLLEGSNVGFYLCVVVCVQLFFPHNTVCQRPI